MGGTAAKAGTADTTRPNAERLSARRRRSNDMAVSFELKGLSFQRGPVVFCADDLFRDFRKRFERAPPGGPRESSQTSPGRARRRLVTAQESLRRRASAAGGDGRQLAQHGRFIEELQVRVFVFGVLEGPVVAEEDQRQA